jgi:cysteine-rich repeat protein
MSVTSPWNPAWQDRRFIMKKAAKNIIRFLQEWDRVAIIEFNSTATTKQSLTAYLGFDKINEIIRPDNSMWLTNYEAAYTNLTTEITNNINSFADRKQLVFFISDWEATIWWFGCSNDDRPCQITRSSSVANTFKNTYPDINIVALWIDPTSPDMEKVLREDITRFTRDYYQANSSDGASCDSIDTNVNSIISASRTLLCSYACISRCGDGIKEDEEGCDDGSHCSNWDICDTNSDCNWIEDWLCIPRSWDGCSSTCEPEQQITNAVCSSNYNNKEIYRTGIAGVGLTGTTVWLCTTGTPTQFSYDAAKAEWTWTCESTGSPASCKAKEIRCGDTVTQSGNGEQCDDGANSNVWDGCNAQCKTTTNAVCSSNYNNKEIYRTGIAGVGLTGTTVWLCTTGTPTQFSYDAAKAEWTWTCESTGSPASCKAKEIRCGDTVTQSGNGEQCDDGANSNVWDGCNAQCKTTTNAVCSSNYNNKEIYRTGIAGVGLTGTTVWLCTTGTPTQFSYDAAKAEWTWTCESTGSPASCKAKEIRCGDTVTQSGNGEQCDGPGWLNQWETCTELCIKKTPSYGGSVPTNPKEPESPKKEQPRIPPVLKKLIERPAVELEPFIEQLPVVLPKTWTILYYWLIGILLSSILTIVLYYYKKEE